MADEPRPIRLRGVRTHNLKGLDLDLPRNRLVVITGVSGSGKSSLAFDTLYAEGQRRYIETFSAETRQFLERLDKPDADLIEGLPPAIAVGQRVGRRSARTTVGTLTEVHDHLALLYAKARRVVCLDCGREVKPSTPLDVVAAIEALPDGCRYLIAFPLDLGPDSDPKALAERLREEGFVRVRVGDQVVTLESGPLPITAVKAVDVIVDRLTRGTESPARRLDSIETAFLKGLGRCRLVNDLGDQTFLNGWRCGGCGRDYIAPEPRLFLDNSPLGACPICEGFGRIVDFDLDRIVPDRSKSVRDGAILPWTMPAYREWNDQLIEKSIVPLDVPFDRLTATQVQAIVEGLPKAKFGGLRGFFHMLERKTYKMHIRVFLSRWRSYSPCPSCLGARLRPEALAVKVGGLNIAELSALTIGEAKGFIDALEVGTAASRALEPVRIRLDYLGRIGLDYLTLDRLARTLSGGEARRVALTAALGSGLVNTLYVLDEPSIGLHPRDVGRLIGTMAALRDAGNSVVVVEHDEAVMRAADVLIDIGPGAGEAGGRLVYAGPPEGIVNVEGSATGDVLAGRRPSGGSTSRRQPKGQIELVGANGHNLKGIDVAFPLGVFCVVTGVSGSGKSTLVEETLHPALLRALKNESLPSEPYRELRGVEAIGDVALIDQSPIGRSARSIPVTYLKAFDEIRKTFAETHESKARNYGPSRFSFNVTGGRCDACEGNGIQTIDMQFLADVSVRCPECHGTRYRRETLEVQYRGKSIAEVLDLTVREAFGFFRHRPKVQSRLRPLLDVGLDYLRLGQPASTLSGGEAQRLKLAGFLASTPAAMTRAASGPKTLFLLDEPTTGLHPADVETLLAALNALVDLGHSLIVVEHAPEVMARADWIIDLGPEAGAGGGRVVARGTPEVVASTDTHTGRVLAARGLGERKTLKRPRRPRGTA